MSTRDFVALVRQYVEKKPIAPSALAVKAGLASGALRTLNDPKWSPRIETQEKLQAVIDADPDWQRDQDAA